MTTMTPNETSPDQAVEAVARAIGKVLGLDIGEVCGITEDAGECDSSTCPGALTEDHDAEDSVETLRRMATAAIAAIPTPPPAGHTDLIARLKSGAKSLEDMFVQRGAPPHMKCSQVVAMLEAADALQAHASPREWQDIATAPKDGSHVLLYEGSGDTYRGAWLAECECWASYCGQPVIRTPEPELWMPYPHPEAARTALELG